MVAVLLALAVLALGGSLWWARRARWSLALGALVLAAAGLRGGLAIVEDFLHPWDEQYHAVVARSLLDAPLHPQFYPKRSPLQHDPTNWKVAKTWLHKPPLFLWQMAASMKLLGPSIWAMRLPSVLLGSLSVGLLFLFLRPLLGPARAYAAAVLMAVCAYQIDLAGGLSGMDHNDTAFLFYSLAALLAGQRLLQNGHWAWAAVLALATASAILCKWLLGLAPLLLVAGVAIFSGQGWRWLPKWAAALALALVPWAWWQNFILLAYPTEARHELAYNLEHLLRVTEGNGGNLLFYAQTFPQLYSSLALLLLPLGLWALFWQPRPAQLWLGGLLVGVYGFFSLAQSKLAHYALLASPAVFAVLSLAAGQLAGKKLGPMLVLGALALSLAKPWMVLPNHTVASPTFLQRRMNAQYFAQLRPCPKCVVLGVPPDELGQALWFGDAIPYAQTFNPSLADSLRARGWTVVVVKPTAYGLEELLRDEP